MDLQLNSHTDWEIDQFHYKRNPDYEGSYCYPLLNIPNQKYAFGSEYEGEKEGEEFFFFPYIRKDAGSVTAFVISVDEEGKFWIESNSGKNVFLNKKKVKAGKKLQLKLEDSISLEKPCRFGEITESNIFSRLRDHHKFSSDKCQRFLFFCRRNFTSELQPVFRLEEHKRRRRLEQEEWRSMEQEMEKRFKASAEYEKTDAEIQCGFADSFPWDNIPPLVLSKIFAFLNIQDLKECRLVSKHWEEESRNFIPQEGKVSLKLKDDSHGYLHPNISHLIFSFLHEMSFISLKELELKLPSNNEKGKLFDDLRKLIHKTTFTTLSLTFDIQSETDLEIFKFILLNMELVDFEFVGDFLISPPPEKGLLPCCKSLSKFSHKCNENRSEYRFLYYDDEDWDRFFIPFLKGVESICLNEKLFNIYFPIEEPEQYFFPSLKQIFLESIVFSGHHCLKNIENLVVLEILNSQKVEHFCKDAAEGFQKLFYNNSKTLVKMKIHFPPDLKCNLFFPNFPKLEQLEIFCNSEMKINWENGRFHVEYDEVFPKIRVLRIAPKMYDLTEQCSWFPFQLCKSKDDIFHSFFPDFGPVVPNVTELCEPSLYEIDGGLYEDRLNLRKKLKNIAEMFPNVKNEEWVKIRENGYDDIEKGDLPCKDVKYYTCSMTFSMR